MSLRSFERNTVMKMSKYLDNGGEEIKEGMIIYSCEVVYFIVKKHKELYATNREFEIPLDMLSTRRFKIKKKEEGVGQ